jgi:hypothetical protein
MNESNGKFTTSSLWPLVAVLSEIATREPAAPLASEPTESGLQYTLDPIPAETLEPFVAPEIGDVSLPYKDEGDTK